MIVQSYIESKECELQPIQRLYEKIFGKLSVNPNFIEKNNENHRKISCELGHLNFTISKVTKLTHFYEIHITFSPGNLENDSIQNYSNHVTFLIELACLLARNYKCIYFNVIDEYALSNVSFNKNDLLVFPYLGLINFFRKEIIKNIDISALRKTNFFKCIKLESGYLIISKVLENSRVYFEYNPENTVRYIKYDLLRKSINAIMNNRNADNMGGKHEN